MRYCFSLAVKVCNNPQINLDTPFQLFLSLSGVICNRKRTCQNFYHCFKVLFSLGAEGQKIFLWNCLISLQSIWRLSKKFILTPGFWIMKFLVGSSTCQVLYQCTSKHVRKWKKILFVTALFIFPALTSWQNISTLKNWGKTFWNTWMGNYNEI